MIRIASLIIRNIKNVAYGEVELNAIEEDTYGSSIVGIYGQNGSGKTSLIYALGLLRDLLSGSPIQKDAGHYIRSGSPSCSLVAEFSLDIHGRPYSLIYTVSLEGSENGGAHILDERLEAKSPSFEGSPRMNLTTLFQAKAVEDGLSELGFSLGKSLEKAFKGEKQKLFALQMLSRAQGTSYLFNAQFVSLLSSLCGEAPSQLVSSLHSYAKNDFFVLNKNADLSSSFDLLPLSLRLQGENGVTKLDRLSLSLGKNECDEATYRLAERALSQIDVLLNSLVPGLQVKMVNLEKGLGKNGEALLRFELASLRGETLTPLRYESEGIKKILCVLSSLIAMYNDPSVLVAIDELDSGVFEYLLGELLLVIKESGKGQLVFTSHNMRPLEVLDKESIYVTTVNPNDKYIRFAGVKEHNNLRSTFLRAIDLGGQKEEIYEPTSKYEMASAFRKAGDAHE